MDGVGLYLHFPFCARKCLYCDFLSFPAGEDEKKLYASAMVREIRACADLLHGRTVDSIFLGGGTPSVMPAGSMREIMRAVNESFRISPDAEITMEMNPGTVNPRILSFASEYVNRVSLGVQSADREELGALGRIHSAEDAERTFGMLRGAGIGNISLDLMLAVPGQTEQSLLGTLGFAAGLMPDHISCYSLIVEDGTPFAAMEERGELDLPDEETERKLYYLARGFLEDRGYRRYEISNFAKQGRSCRHNMRYWKRGDYLGIGLGASSLFDHSRWKNTPVMREYLEDSGDPGRLVRELTRLDLRGEIEEFMFLGLRMDEGVSGDDFRENFSLELTDVYGDVIGRLAEEGLMEKSGRDRFRLTDRGVDVSNRVLAEFLFDGPEDPSGSPGPF